MKRSFLKGVLALLLPVALLTGCWQEDSALQDESEFLQAVPEDTPDLENRVVLPELFSLPYAPGLTLDPVTCPDGMQQVVSSLLCEGLFRLDSRFEVQPWLCESYIWNRDTNTYVLTLREVMFSDGTPLTAADAKTTLERARTSERYASRLDDITSIAAEGKTVTITLSAPNSAFPALLDIPIVKSGTEERPIGTGPYLFSQETSGAFLIANQSWWQGGQQPTERIALVETSDQDAMLYRFSSHDVQLITADLTDTSPISATHSVSCQDAETTILQYIGCNVRKEPFNNSGFREALSIGIHRENLVTAFLSGHGQPSQFPVSPVSALYPSDLEKPYSTDAFAAALAKSGYTPDRTLTLLVNEENSFKVAVAGQIASRYTAAGVPVEIRALPWADYMAALAAGDFDLYYGEVKLTADWDISALLGSNGALNYGGWTDEQTDRLLAEFAAAEDRTAASRRLCAYLQAKAPILPVCFKSTSVLMQSHVLTGLSPTMAEPFYNLTDCVINLRPPS